MSAIVEIGATSSPSSPIAWCQAYLIAKSPKQIAGLHNVVRGAGFKSSFDVSTGDGILDVAAPIKFFFVHFKVPDSEKISAIAKVRACREDGLRFSLFILIIDDCDYEDVVKYVHMGFDDVISLPEKANILRHRLQAQLTAEQTYFETPTYFGPDRRRMDAPVTNEFRTPEGGKHIRYRVRRDPEMGVQVIQQVLLAA